MTYLSPGTKLNLLGLLLNRRPLQAFVGGLSDAALWAAHRFVWEKTLEFGIKMKGKSFPQDAVNNRLQGIAKTHHDRGCAADLKYCSPEECVAQHPQCARAVLLEQITAMEQMTREFFQGGE
jgi:hypothetical protein